jgi:hypothetical protein
MAAAYEPPVSDDRGPLVIRPSWRALGLWDLRIAVFALLGCAAGAARLLAVASHGVGWLIVTGAIVVGGYGLFFAYQGLYMLGTRITVTADSILITHWFRSTARVACRDIARVVRLSVAYDSSDGFPRPAVFAFSAQGRCLLSLFAQRWSQADLERIWQHLGITPEGSWDCKVFDNDLGTEFPGAF